MKKIIKISFLLSIITSLYANVFNIEEINDNDNIEIVFENIESTQNDEATESPEYTNAVEFIDNPEFTENVEFSTDNNGKTEEGDLPNDDKFYMIFINNTFSDISTSQDQERQERQDSSDEFIHSVVGEIHNLIVGNKDTYKNPEKLEELDYQDSQLKKRNSDIKFLLDYDDYSNYVYPISTVNDRTVLYAYLSNDLVGTIKSMPNVIDCVPNRRFKFDSHYSSSSIRSETKWESVKVREDADLHLSILSQGKYNEDLISQYDTNYYYPSSAGKDIDIFIFDTGFNFRHGEFSNTDERTTKCAFRVQKGKIVSSSSSTACNTADLEKYNYVHHGEMVADVVAGKTHGVARKANVYGIIPDGLDYQDEANVIAGLQYIKDHLLRPNKAIFNFSFGEYYDMDDNNEVIAHWQSLINEITEIGAVFVTSAGNNNTPVINKSTNQIKYPCAFDSMICVGGIDNSSNGSKEMKSWYYYKAKASNYGNGVDIYAPAYATVAYRDSYGRDRESFAGGTSIASPIVAGVIATIMSENPDIEFNTDKMIKYLKVIGEKDIVKDLSSDGPNLFINNGKHIVYSKDSVYYGCGIYSGKQKCSSNKCCSVDGYCKSSTSSSCKTSKGCQSRYGTCTIVTSAVEGKCGNGYGNCHSGYCCSSNGYCGKTSEYCEFGCQSNYGLCN